ncbi:MAG TPA: hypothetical protein VM934_17855 [Pyrinomonadaceae bacterium]|nr:hypothetical protein [Pyrinomonadaceae bacterium]
MSRRIAPAPPEDVVGAARHNRETVVGGRRGMREAAPPPAEACVEQAGRYRVINL